MCSCDPPKCPCLQNVKSRELYLLSLLVFKKTDNPLQINSTKTFADGRKTIPMAKEITKMPLLGLKRTLVKSSLPQPFLTT